MTDDENTIVYGMLYIVYWEGKVSCIFVVGQNFEKQKGEENENKKG